MNTEDQKNTHEDREVGILSPKKLVWSKGKKAITNSLKVADIFEIPHDNVFRSIENLDCAVSEEFCQCNFFYKGQTSIEMTKNGFFILVYRLSDSSAMQDTVAIEAYLSEFDYVEDLLNQFDVTVPQYVFLMKFWAVVEKLNANNAINHSNNVHTELALNIDQLYACCAEQNLSIPQFKLIRPLLVSDSFHPFIANKPVLSRLTKKTMRCWVFKIN